RPCGAGNRCRCVRLERRKMSLFDAFRYDGKRALVVGGATGMGAATAELVKDAGAEVVVMDRAEVTLDGVKAISLDLSDKASIDAAVEECGGPVHALFSCAGVEIGRASCRGRGWRVAR